MSSFYLYLLCLGYFFWECFFFQLLPYACSHRRKLWSHEVHVCRSFWPICRKQEWQNYAAPGHIEGMMFIYFLCVHHIWKLSILCPTPAKFKACVCVLSIVEFNVKSLSYVTHSHATDISLYPIPIWMHTYSFRCRSKYVFNFNYIHKHCVGQVCVCAHLHHLWLQGLHMRQHHHRILQSYASRVRWFGISFGCQTLKYFIGIY